MEKRTPGEQKVRLWLALNDLVQSSPATSKGFQLRLATVAPKDTLFLLRRVLNLVRERRKKWSEKEDAWSVLCGKSDPTFDQQLKSKSDLIKQTEDLPHCGGVVQECSRGRFEVGSRGLWMSVGS